MVGPKHQGLSQGALEERLTVLALYLISAGTVALLGRQCLLTFPSSASASSLSLARILMSYEHLKFRVNDNPRKARARCLTATDISSASFNGRSPFSFVYLS
jgi:hypothetical protein